MTDATQPTGTAEQDVINPALPGNLNLVLNAKGALTVATSSQVFGDVGASGPNGSVLFDVASTQSCCGFNVLANTVTVNISATVGHIFGNDITVNGSASQQSLGLNPAALPQVPAVTPAAPGTTNVSTGQNQAKQLCPGKYGAISLGINSTLNLNGGVYQVTKLTLADGARLEPSEPVVILVSGGVTTGIGAAIRPSAQAINPMTAADVRLEIGGAITIGDGTQLRAHVLGAGKLTTGKNAVVSGAAWAKTISIGAQNFIGTEGAFSAVAPSVPPPCNDNNACTADACVGSGSTVGFCSNNAAPSGTSCDDGAICNGIAVCDGAGTCQPGATASTGTACPDATVCNGDETCDGFGSCVPGAPPVVNDGNSCTTDVCDAVTGVSHVALPDGTVCAGTGVCVAGTCSIQAFALVGINSFGEFDRIDPDTLSVTTVGPIGVPYAFGDCMFNPSDAKLYMVDGRGNQGLYTLDVATGAASLIGSHGVAAMEAIAFHPPTNQVYALSYDNGAMYSMNTTTGAATFVGSTPLFFQGMAWDSKREVMIAYDGTTLSSVNMANASMTALTFFGGVNNFGMTYDAARDRFWIADDAGRLIQVDPNAGYAATFVGFLPSGHTCIAAIPQ